MHGDLLQQRLCKGSLIEYVVKIESVRVSHGNDCADMNAMKRSREEEEDDKEMDVEYLARAEHEEDEEDERERRRLKKRVGEIASDIENMRLISVSGFNEGSVTNNKEEKTKDFFEAVAVASVLTCRTDIIDAARKNSKDANFDKFGTILKRVNKLPPGIDIKAIIDRARDIASRRSRAKHGYDDKSMIKNSNDSLLEEEEKEEGDFDESPFKGSIFAAMLEIREDYVLE